MASRLATPAWLAAFLVVVGGGVAQVPMPGSGLTAEWIWCGAGDGAGRCGDFRHRLVVPGRLRRADLLVACDDRFTAWVNGVEVLAGDDWQRPGYVDLRRSLQVGSNVLAVSGRNDRGPAGLCVRLRLELVDGRKFEVVSGTHWWVAEVASGQWRVGARDRTARGEARWRRPVSHGAVAAMQGPWTDVLAQGSAIPARELQLPEGFVAELLCSARPGQGSWQCLTFDAQGRVLVAPERGGLKRITLPGRIEDWSEVAGHRFGRVRGMLSAFDSLYLSVDARQDQGGGLYRLRDTDADGAIDAVSLLRAFDTVAGAGAHGLVDGADGMLYLVQGKDTVLPTDLDSASAYRHYGEDLLRDREEDPSGQSVGVLAPGGRVLRTDPAGRRWELLAGGLRDPHDLAFDEHGELFTFDAALAWDHGLPWYRPSQVLQVVAGGEYGWRGGSAKSPPRYLDVLPPLVRTGLGSAAGMVFGTGSAFPPAYRRGLFLADPAVGQVLVAHLQRQGAGYAAVVEPFVRARGLSVVDLTIGPDGALYFITSGMGGQSGLYRVRHVDAPAPVVPSPSSQVSALLRVDRQADLGALWQRLAAPDRLQGFAARVALEFRPVAQWRARALTEPDPVVALRGLLALARAGSQEDGAAVLRRLASADFSLAEEADFLRVLSVAWSRHGAPGAAQKAALLALLDGRFRSGDAPRDADLAVVLASLAAPRLVERCLEILDAPTARATQIHHAMLLRNVGDGWTPALRQRYFAWLRRARSWRGGTNLQGYLEAIDRAARQRDQPVGAK